MIKGISNIQTSGRLISMLFPFMVLNSVEFAEGESVVETYHAADIKKPSKGKAEVILTDKRVIISYQTKTSQQISDVNINDVRGADIAWAEAQRNWIGVISSFIVGLSLVGSSFTGWPTTAFMLSIGLPVMGFGAYLFLRKKPTFVIIIYSQFIVPTLMIHNVTSGIMDQSSNQLKLKLDGKPGPDAQKMSREIGHKILDIQEANLKNRS